VKNTEVAQGFFYGLEIVSYVTGMSITEQPHDRQGQPGQDLVAIDNSNAASHPINSVGSLTHGINITTHHQEIMAVMGEAGSKSAGSKPEVFDKPNSLG
jgi:hypothetical protein